jgi:hypothetical protein
MFEVCPKHRGTYGIVYGYRFIVIWWNVKITRTYIIGGSGFNVPG